MRCKICGSDKEDHSCSRRLSKILDEIYEIIFNLEEQEEFINKGIAWKHDQALTEIYEIIESKTLKGEN